MKQIDEAEELELLTLSESDVDIWQRIKARKFKTGQSLNSQAIEKFFEVERSIRYRPLMSQQRFLDFKDQLVTHLGIDSQDRIYSKGEEKKLRNNPMLDLGNFDEMIQKWQEQYNKGENLFSNGSIEELWKICKKFRCRNIAEQDLRPNIEQFLATLKSELVLPQPTPLESMLTSLQFFCEAFGNNCRLTEIDPNYTLNQIVQAEFDSYQPPEHVINFRVNTIRGNYLQIVQDVQSRVNELAEFFTTNPEQLHAAELTVGMIDDLALQVESSDDFRRFRDSGYKISGSKTIRCRIDHQQSTYREHDIESEDSLLSTYINNDVKSTAQTLLLMMINLRGIVREMLHNPQRLQVKQYQLTT